MNEPRPWPALVTDRRCRLCDVGWRSADGGEDCWACGRPGTREPIRSGATGSTAFMRGVPTDV